MRLFFTSRIRRRAWEGERGGVTGLGRVREGGYDHVTQTNPKPCYLRRLWLLIQHVQEDVSCSSTRGAVTGVHHIFEHAQNPATSICSFRLFIQHVAGGYFMFSNTRLCHKCSSHSAGMPQTLLFAAILPLYTTCVSLNTSTAGSGARGSLREGVLK